MKTALLIAVLAALLGAAVFLAARFGPWGQGGDASPHMWIALGLGAGLSFLLGAGLMALSFHSQRRGYDDAAARDD
jgi:hypothetical protein